MKKFASKLILTACLYALSLTAFAVETSLWPLFIIVITTDSHPIQITPSLVSQLTNYGSVLEQFNLDDLGRFEEVINRQISHFTDEEKARAAFEQHLRTLGEATFNQQLMDAHRALITALQHKVSHYPAIIFDKQFVVYGVTDMREAIDTYLNFKTQGRNHNG